MFIARKCFSWACLSVRLLVCESVWYLSSSPETLCIRQFQPWLTKNIIEWGGFNFFSNKKANPFPRGDNSELLKKNIDDIQNLQNHWANINNLACTKRSQVCEIRYIQWQKNHLTQSILGLRNIVFDQTNIHKLISFIMIALPRFDYSMYCLSYDQ